MSKYRFDNHHATAGEIYRDYQKKIQAVLEDDNLSDSGKSRAIAELKSQRSALLSKLKNNLAIDAQKKRDILSRKSDPKPTIRENLRRRAEEDAEMFSSTYSDDVRFNELISAVEKVEKRFGDFLETWAILQRDEPWFRKELQRGLDSKNVLRLEQLSKALPLLPDGDISERLQSEYGAAISSLKEEMLTPAERAARRDVEELDKAVELFNYRIASIETRDEDVDPRQQEIEPATILTAVNPRLGRAHPVAEFQRYKNGGTEGAED